MKFRTVAIAALSAVPWLLNAMPVQELGKVPRMPATPYKYADADMDYPRYFWDPNVMGSVAPADNTPATNPVTNPGAALGRVLFYDVRLSRNFTVSCGSCHRQSHGFSDPARFSTGLYGGLTSRHSMGLTNSRYYVNGRFFWDERAASLEEQVLQPIQNSVEMDLTLNEAVQRVQSAPFYATLFKDAFGTTEVTPDRVSKALSQFVRSIVSYRSKFDSAIDVNGVPHFDTVFTQQEFLGMRLFQPVPGFPNIARGCDRCHSLTCLLYTSGDPEAQYAVYTATLCFQIPDSKEVGR